MKTSSNSRSVKKNTGKIASVLKGSVIISALDRLCLWIYSLLGSGLFAKVFSTRYRGGVPRNNGAGASPVPLNKLRVKLSRMIDSSSVVKGITKLAENAVYCKLRVIGLYLATFAAYTCVLALLSLIINETVASRFDAYTRLVEAVTIGISSVFFLSSRKNLSQIIASSRICTSVISALGFTVKSPSEESVGRYVPAFILGTVSGFASVAVPPMYIFIAIAAVIYLYTVLATPEFGVMSLFFLMPFAPTMILAGLVLLVAFAYGVKLIRGKRVLNFEKLDFFTLIFAVLIFFSGFISLSTGSIAPSIIFTVFIMAYFLVSCCVRSAEWLTRCTAALMFSALIVSMYGIFQYVFGSAMTAAWLDSDLFDGISGRAVATLENPNMLGEYLIMIIPVVAGLWLSGAAVKKKTSFVAFACMCMCLVLTWSRGAWIGFLVAFMVFLLIWNRRSIWIIVGGIASLPFLTVILPDTIVSRITSIGNMADTSTNYRVGIWRGAMHMIEDHLLSGIGIGEKAWEVIYPDYTLPGIEEAPHSHNLFMQITLESGIFALVIFGIILFLATRNSFSLFSALSDRTGSGIEKNDGQRMRLAVAGPLCGILAVLIQGLTDYSWYNYRVYLMFWLTVGLIPAFIKTSEHKLMGIEAKECAPSEHEAELDIKL